MSKPIYMGRCYRIELFVTALQRLAREADLRRSQRKGIRQHNKRIKIEEVAPAQSDGPPILIDLHDRLDIN
jgi:hypothetical protein